MCSLFYVTGDYRPADVDLQEGAGVGVHAFADLPRLKLTPFVRRVVGNRGADPVLQGGVSRDPAVRPGEF